MDFGSFVSSLMVFYFATMEVSWAEQKEKKNREKRRGTIKSLSIDFMICLQFSFNVVYAN